MNQNTTAQKLPLWLSILGTAAVMCILVVLVNLFTRDGSVPATSEVYGIGEDV